MVLNIKEKGFFLYRKKPTHKRDSEYHLNAKIVKISDLQKKIINLRAESLMMHFHSDTGHRRIKFSQN